MVTLLRLIIRILVPFFRRRHRRWKNGEPIECLVVGYGGANNTGAEARTSEAIGQMLAVDDRIRVTLTSLNRKRTLRYLEENDRLKVAGINPVFVFSMARLVAASDIVVLAEGSCFKENFSPALLWFFIYSAEFAQRLGIPVATYGVDAGPLSARNAEWARGVAEKMDLIMVRTEAAKERLREIGVTRPVEVTTDTAFSLTPARREWVETVLGGRGVDPKKPLVGIAFEEFFWWPVVPKPFKALVGVTKDRYKSIYYHSWGANGAARSEALKDAVAAYADWVSSERGAQVIFFAMESLDSGPCKDVMARMKAESVLIDADHATAAQMTAALRHMEWLVTCRYHAFVLAMGGLVPTIGLGHDERIATIMDELDLLSDYFIPYDEDRPFEMLKGKTELLMKNVDSVRRRVESALPSYRERMGRNQSLFAELVRERF